MPVRKEGVTFGSYGHPTRFFDCRSCNAVVGFEHRREVAADYLQQSSGSLDFGEQERDVATGRSVVSLAFPSSSTTVRLLPHLLSCRAERPLLPLWR
jgi:hypothetical protein